MTDALHQSRTFEMEDANEGIQALLEDRKPLFKGRCANAHYREPVGRSQLHSLVFLGQGNRSHW